MENNIPVLYRVLFSFSKHDEGIMLPHLALQELFHKAFLRSALPIVYTSGFNPLPRLELACSLSMGIRSSAEIASCLLYEPVQPETFNNIINSYLPKGITVLSSYIFPVTNKLKRESLASLYWGASYEILCTDNTLDVCLQSADVQSVLKECKYQSDGAKLLVTVPFPLDKKLRTVMEEAVQKDLYSFAEFNKKESLAVLDSRVMTYFNAYEIISKRNKELIEE